MLLSQRHKRLLTRFLNTTSIISRATLGQAMSHFVRHTSEPRLTVIAMIRDEIDIIDSFCLQALELFDRAIFFDHNSTDSSSEYVTYISQKHPQIEIYQLHMTGHYQSELMTWALRMLCNSEHGNAWVFFLDADEFLPFDSRQALINELQNYAHYPIISLRWHNLVPDSFEEEDLAAKRLCDPGRLSPIRKVAVQPRYLQKHSHIVSQGNHSIVDVATGCSIYARPAFELFHVPVRSRTQLMNKIQRSMAGYQAKKGACNTVHGVHYNIMKTLTERHDYSDDVLAFIATHYGNLITSLITGSYIAGYSRQVRSAVELPFITHRSLWSEKYGLPPSHCFDKNAVSQGGHVTFRVIEHVPDHNSFRLRKVSN